MSPQSVMTIIWLLVHMAWHSGSLRMWISLLRGMMEDWLMKLLLIIIKSIFTISSLHLLLSLGIWSLLLQFIILYDPFCLVRSCGREEGRERGEAGAVLVSGASLFPFSTALFLFVGFLSVFLLYIIHTEAGVVVMLSVFKAIAAPGWSITSVLVADIFPTSLRYAYHCCQLNYLYQSFICCSCSDCYFYLLFVADLQLWVYSSSLLK